MQKSKKISTILILSIIFLTTSWSESHDIEKFYTFKNKLTVVKDKVSPYYKVLNEKISLLHNECKKNPIDVNKIFLIKKEIILIKKEIEKIALSYNMPLFSVDENCDSVDKCRCVPYKAMYKNQSYAEQKEFEDVSCDKLTPNEKKLINELKIRLSENLTEKNDKPLCD